MAMMMALAFIALGGALAIELGYEAAFQASTNLSLLTIVVMASVIPSVDCLASQALARRREPGR